MSGAGDAPVTGTIPEEMRTVKLDFPVEFPKGQELTEVHLPARVLGKHLKAMDKSKGEIGKSFMLLAAMSGLPPYVFDEMDARDFAKFEPVLIHFFPDAKTEA